MPQAWYQYPITQRYGQNGEEGVDLGTPFHSPVTALFAGTVRWAGRNKFPGAGSSGGQCNIVCMIPGKGVFTSYYLHLDTCALKVGDVVQAGAFIGLSGGQVGYGNWPVVNAGGHVWSTGPHTEFGFNANFVSGPGHHIDPTWAIDAARAGQLPITTPDGAAVVPLASGGSATTSPDMVQTALIRYAALSSVTHRVITEPVGFDGICEALDNAESFAPWNPMNPFLSVWRALPPILIRGFFLVLGLAILYAVFWTLLAPVRGAIANTLRIAVPFLGQAGGAGAAGGSAAVLEEAPAALAV